MKPPYYSALSSTRVNLDGYEPVVACDNGKGSKAFTHNICEGLPAQMRVCDVLIAQSPYPAGQQWFNEQAGHTTSHKAVVQVIRDMFDTVEQPFFVLGPKLLLTTAPPKHVTRIPIMLNGGLCYLFAANVAEGILQTLQQGVDVLQVDHFFLIVRDHYECAGDFFCGLGQTPRNFLEVGKQCIASDYNGRCISYIKENLFK